MTLDVVIFIFGALLLGIALLGGNFQLGGSLTIPPVPSFIRGLSAVIGVFFICLALWFGTRLNTPIPPIAVVNPTNVSPTETTLPQAQTFTSLPTTIISPTATLSSAETLVLPTATMIPTATSVPPTETSLPTGVFVPTTTPISACNLPQDIQPVPYEFSEKLSFIGQMDSTGTYKDVVLERGMPRGYILRINPDVSRTLYVNIVNGCAAIMVTDIFGNRLTGLYGAQLVYDIPQNMEYIIVVSGEGYTQIEFRLPPT